MIKLLKNQTRSQPNIWGLSFRWYWGLGKGLEGHVFPGKSVKGFIFLHTIWPLCVGQRDEDIMLILFRESLLVTSSLLIYAFINTVCVAHVAGILNSTFFAFYIHASRQCAWVIEWCAMMSLVEAWAREHVYEVSPFWHTPVTNKSKMWKTLKSGPVMVLADSSTTIGYGRKNTFCNSCGADQCQCCKYENEAIIIRHYRWTL